MSEQQPSPQQKRARTGRQTRQERLAGYRKLLQSMHNRLLTENDLRIILRDEQTIQVLLHDLSEIFKWIKTVDEKEEMIKSFTNALGKEVKMFENILEDAIFHLNVVLDNLDEAKQALAKNPTEQFSNLRLAAYRKLKECRECIQQALRLFK